jgi:hypothetical protein
MVLLVIVSCAYSLVVNARVPSINEGLLNKVKWFSCPEISNHVLPLPGYDFGLVASRYNTRFSVVIFGPPDNVLIL